MGRIGAGVPTPLSTGPAPPGAGLGFARALPALLLIQAQGPGRVPSRIQGLPGDSVSLSRPPLPGGVADLVRALFEVPRWVQVGGFILGILVLAGLVAIAWWQRAELLAWFTMRSRRTVLAAGAGVAVLVAGFAWFSLRSWNYMQHDNDFCSGCHVMAPAWQKFQTTKHARLSCHQCHQQSIFASARQLVLWVADRPGAIPAHSKVPNARCIACHVQGDAKRWKQIAATEGHRLHLESPRLPGLQCVRCHGFSVHQFVPSDLTCGQAGCHTSIRIRLGKMSNVTALHCAVCHVFTRQAAAPTSVSDSLRRWLTPTRVECFSCHAMQKLMVDQQLAHDPHGAVCGACHNPHTQTEAAQAVRSCTNAGCHARPETITPFHRGLGPAALASCTSCHKPHSWKTHGAGNCTACHGDIFKSGGAGPAARASVSPPAMPWPRLYARLLTALRSPDPVAAFARGSAGAAGAPGRARADAGAPRGWLSVPRDAGGAPFRFAGILALGDVPAFTARRARASAVPQEPQQPTPQQPTPQQPTKPQQPPKPSAPEPRTGAVPAPVRPAPPAQVAAGPFRGFAHDVHRGVTCTVCHSMRSAHGALLVRSVEDCLRCHHERSGLGCTSCHAPATLPQDLQRDVAFQTSTAPTPVTRTLPFSHGVHASVACATCHAGPPTLRTVRACTSCHESHHADTRTCRTCHVPSPYDQHSVSAHLTCAGASCHHDPAVTALAWSREVCLACHQDRVQHMAGQACAGCHAVPALDAAARRSAP